MRRISIAAVVLSLVVGLASAPAKAGLIGEKTELQMGRDAAKQIEAKYKVSTDKGLTKQVEEMGKKIAAKSSRPGLPWVFKVLDTKEVNAFSVPGYVYINKGLMDFTAGDTDALAGVVAHEIAHTTAKHAAKTAEKQLTYSLAIQLLSKKGDARKLGSIAANLTLLGYSRKDEFQADQLGVDYMHAAGYDPNGMLRFFRKLQSKEGSSSGGVLKFLQTHPPTKDRIKRVEDRIAKLGGKPEPAPQPATEQKTSSGGIRISDLALALLFGASTSR
jgi:predicted Zn-dependent protease